MIQPYFPNNPADKVEAELCEVCRVQFRKSEEAKATYQATGQDFTVQITPESDVYTQAIVDHLTAVRNLTTYRESLQEAA